MKFSSALAFIAVAAFPVFGAPAPEAEVEAIEKRDLSVYVCEQANWGAPCVSFLPFWNQCYPFSALGLSGYQSWGPGTGTTCLWYTGPACTGTQSGAVNNPGYADVPDFWKFNTASWKCWD